ncbi:MAG: response regulator transcription factor [Chloroflexota bacterium]
MSNSIRLILCDDQAIVTEGLQVILGAVRDFDVIGVAHDGAEAVDLVAALQPDLVLMDLRMPIMNGIQATRKICETYPQTKILVLTTYDDDGWVFDAIRAGASGYLLKDTPREQLVAAIRGTVAGTTHVDPNVAGKLFQELAQVKPTMSDRQSPQSKTVAQSTPTTIGVDLSNREREVLKMLANGLSNSDIAAQLHLSKGTIQNYVSNIFVKLDVSDRTQAAVVALRHGLA